MSAGVESARPIKLDAPFYTEEELDRHYESDPVAALRISREQTILQRQLAAQLADSASATLIERNRVRGAAIRHHCSVAPP